MLGLAQKYVDRLFSLKQRRRNQLTKYRERLIVCYPIHYFLSHFVFDQTGVKPSLHVSFSCCLLQLLIVRFSVKI